MGLFTIKGKTALVPRVRQTLEAMERLGATASKAGLDTLTRLTQGPVTLGATQVALVPWAALDRLLVHHAKAKVGARFAFGGEVPGVVATLFGDVEARNLVDLLIGKPLGTTKKLGDLETSAIAEMTNIALNGALNALAEEGGMHFVTQVPEVLRDPGKELGRFFRLGDDVPTTIRHGVLIEAPFTAQEGRVAGTMVVILGLQGEAGA